jgi:hypothetical protein
MDDIIGIEVYVIYPDQHVVLVVVECGSRRSSTCELPVCIWMVPIGVDVIYPDQHVVVSK